MFMNLSLDSSAIREEANTEHTLYFNFLIPFPPKFCCVIFTLSWHLHVHCVLQPNLTFVLVVVLHLNIFQSSNTSPVCSFPRHPLIGYNLSSSGVLKKRPWRNIPWFLSSTELSICLVLVGKLDSLCTPWLT